MTNGSRSFTFPGAIMFYQTISSPRPINLASGPLSLSSLSGITPVPENFQASLPSFLPQMLLSTNLRHCVWFTFVYNHQGPCPFTKPLSQHKSYPIHKRVLQALLIKKHPRVLISRREKIIYKSNLNLPCVSPTTWFFYFGTLHLSHAPNSSARLPHRAYIELQATDTLSCLKTAGADTDPIEDDLSVVVIDTNTIA